ncbi:phenylacetate-CoA oxygenase subunit PaaJ [Catenulispora sp. NF23]|uniref:Phenylacetate-CoA oxygenase subunit PaaJ n=1 Tax=Catenulispora pinistramenti TaxID=2705254 RepID=A0ABS5KTC7_9ACTN|nr:1,2-phenylacetyl-CoA epoxidase subunit PaaD [Catenulispora pinistramenti]MBS2536776.1 phenylacetate-CoA oxygenase subunit PaaJ [Catenulispora pinistramenti]MBS2549313.1 phenylacetate-CoA oxygenase subunit PaaJ [Catenulispora pinistramenti]
MTMAMVTAGERGRATHGAAAGTAVAGAALDLAALDLAALDLAGLEAAAAAVPDPELPVVTLGDLGIVRGVSLTEDGAVEVRITPTFVGCPATEVIAADVRTAVAAYLSDSGAPAVEVRTRTAMSPPWSTDWISEDGRRKLAEHGIAPPRGGARHAGGPVAVTIGRRGGLEAGPLPGDGASFPAPRAAQACPHCGSTDTREISAFGSTPCQSLRACRACGEPFGAMKSL